MYKDKVTARKAKRMRIRRRIRKKISGTSERPRVLVGRSNRYLCVQAIDDTKGMTLASASTLEKEFREKNKNTKNMEASQKLGELITKRLKEKKIKNIVFDRDFFPYHGRVKHLAEAMRKGGLKF